METGGTRGRETGDRRDVFHFSAMEISERPVCPQFFKMCEVSGAGLWNTANEWAASVIMVPTEIIRWASPVAGSDQNSE